MKKVVRAYLFKLHVHVATYESKHTRSNWTRASAGQRWANKKTSNCGERKRKKVEREFLIQRPNRFECGCKLSPSCGCGRASSSCPGNSAQRHALHGVHTHTHIIIRTTRISKKCFCADANISKLKSSGRLFVNLSSSNVRLTKKFPPVGHLMKKKDTCGDESGEGMHECGTVHQKSDRKESFWPNGGYKRESVWQTTREIIASSYLESRTCVFWEICSDLKSSTFDDKTEKWIECKCTVKVLLRTYSPSLFLFFPFLFSQARLFWSTKRVKRRNLFLILTSRPNWQTHWLEKKCQWNQKTSFPRIRFNWLVQRECTRDHFEQSINRTF